MATELGTYMVALSTSARGISNEIRSQLGTPIDAEAKKAGTRMGGFLSSGMGKAIAAVGGTALIGGVFKSGLSEATNFESGMNEVFTLLPGISGKAMGDMEGQVKSFSKEFGVLPNDAIPALYQSLSAGVPADNVFDFMETANKAAKGGVTDLSTAVDGISSVVNAYGADVIDATETSDLMFTAVRLGKTTFGEMSASMSNVTPVAAAMGVGFEDVTAGLAVLTAQGVPTAQATTQMRAAFAELGKSGSIADKAFTQIAGKSFPQFIAEGGNVQEAFQLMSDGAVASGSSLIDMFGSIEAGQAVMALTKGDGEAFASALGEMQNSAGATQGAFEQMNTGLKPALDKLRANWSVAMVSMGEKLAPFIQAVAEKLPGAMAAVGSALSAIAGPARTFGSALAATFGWLADHKEIVIGALVGITAGLVAWGYVAAATAIANFTLSASFIAAAAPFIAIGAAVAVAVAALVWAYNNITWFRTGVDAVVSWIVGTAWPAIQTAFSAIGSFIASTFSLISGIISGTVNFLKGVWADWGSTIMAVVKFAWNYVKGQIEATLAVITGIWKIFKGLFTADWSLMWAGIKQVLSGALKYIQTILGVAWTIIKTVASAAWTWLKNKAIEIFNSIRDRVTSAVNDVRDRVVRGFTYMKDQAIQKAVALVTWMTSLPGRMVDAIASIVSKLTTKGREALTGMKNGAVEAATDLLSYIGSLPGKALDELVGISSKLYQAGKDLVQGMIDGVKAKAADIASAAREVVTGAINAAKNVLHLGSPSRLFNQFGQWTGEGFINGLTAMAKPVAQAMNTMMQVPEPAMVSVGSSGYAASVPGSGVARVDGSGAGDTYTINVQDSQGMYRELRRLRMLSGARQ